ncbi:unnamed protein product [Nippostrongylus brasiliensis]|uniref:CACTA en-spm transposon protein n=1 Tax=Nippostrongylus brasiliensis TaxID=27835 RepID=A0A0N4YVQ1_NIPBR|nr:unnamed protein product [Nippostrongylus brasiliensis]
MWPRWKAMQFLEKIADTGTPQTSLSSSRDDVSEMFFEDVENIPPEFGSNSRRRPSNNALEQLATAVSDAENNQMDPFEISCLNIPGTLRSTAKYDDALAHDFKFKVDELQLEAAREAVRLRR